MKTNFCIKPKNVASDEIEYSLTWLFNGADKIKLK